MVKRKIFKISGYFLFAILSNQVFGQQLHHQMLATQGNTTTLKSGFTILQTIGQQSVIGNASLTNLTVQQGFQQSLLFSYFPIYSINTITTTVYPNPFRGDLNVNFSELINGEMTVALYNMFGVMIYNEEKQNPALTLNFNFDYLPTGSYVLQLAAKQYSFSKTLIKQ